MPGKRRSEDNISHILSEWAKGSTAEEIAKRHKVSLQTLYRWKRMRVQRNGRAPTQGSLEGLAQHLSLLGERKLSVEQLKRENTRLKLLIADLLLNRIEAV